MTAPKSECRRGEGLRPSPRTPYPVGGRGFAPPPKPPTPYSVRSPHSSDSSLAAPDCLPAWLPSGGRQSVRDLRSGSLIAWLRRSLAREPLRGSLTAAPSSQRLFGRSVLRRSPRILRILGRLRTAEDSPLGNPPPFPRTRPSPPGSLLPRWDPFGISARQSLTAEVRGGSSASAAALIWGSGSGASPLEPQIRLYAGGLLGATQ